MASQYDTFLFWLAQSASGHFSELQGLSPQNQYRKIQNDELRTGRIGKYQINMKMMHALGYYLPSVIETDETSQWRGIWLGRRGLKSLDAFLNHPIAQEYIVREEMCLFWKWFRKLGIDKYTGESVRSTLVTESGLLASAHLFGLSALVSFFSKKDASEYSINRLLDCMKFFAGFQTPYGELGGKNYAKSEFLRYLKIGLAPRIFESTKSAPWEKVEYYIWRTQGDDRVRDSHASNDGEIFSVNDSPCPGDDYNCRCYAEECLDSEYGPLILDTGKATKLLNRAVDSLKREQVSNGNPNEFGKGYCARYVANAVEETLGKTLSKRPDHAKDFGSWLEMNGFVPIAKWDNSGSLSDLGYIEGYDPNMGDVVIIQPYPDGNSSGHMAMYNGEQWVSDFRQRDMWGGPGYRRRKPDYTIYRSGSRY